MQYLDGKGLVPFDVTFTSPLNLGVYDMNYLQNGVVPVPNTGKELADVVK
jgi:hypothetical protein